MFRSISRRQGYQKISDRLVVNGDIDQTTCDSSSRQFTNTKQAYKELI